MAIRSNHYELAFEAWLRTQRCPYVPVNEARRPLAPDRSLKSMDFIVYSAAGPHLLVDVKGRRFPRPGETGHAWECWATSDDVDCLMRWQEFFGGDFRAAFVFAYDLDESVAGTLGDLWSFHGRTYAFYAVFVAEYLNLMRRRSPKWETVSLPTADFRRLRRPVAQML